ncbi:MAG: HD domain-containing protein [Desulfobacteraceae bacterium]|nr:HD domain-containing protein [Desulfobacteraceae bacterium]
MDTFAELIDAIDKGTDHPIRDFDEYHITGRVKKHSQQGIVVFATNKIGKQFAVKFYRPTDNDPRILQEGRERFVSEVEILVTLTHKNIVRVYNAGTATWEQSSNGSQWQCRKGFHDDTYKNTEAILYYIMDYIEGEDISALFPVLSIGSPKPEKPLQGDRVWLFEEMIRQVCSAMAYYHGKEITHKDIKPDNIRYSTIDNTFIVVDFGFARHFGSPQDISAFTKTEFTDMLSLIDGKYEFNDSGQLALVLKIILTSIEKEYDKNRYIGMMSAIDRATGPLKERLNSVDAFKASMEQYFLRLPQWRLKLEPNEPLCSDGFGRFSRKVRIPYSGSVPMPDEVRDITESPEFQRLQGVRQLGPTIFVFPGASHTRYEHSLGVYFLSLRCLQTLLDWSAFRESCPQIDDTVKLMVLSTLLHDLGHYPYSHWIEEIDEFADGSILPSHEQRARDIILSSKLSEVIEHNWGISPEIIANIIQGQQLKEDSHRLINSLIDSATFDIDKLDYLVRDSIHCGVDYGKGIDVQRLLDSVCVAPGTSSLCLTDKGMSCLLSLLSCRNIMYQEVYWHKTVRACDAMFKRFFYEYVKADVDDMDTINTYFDLSDEHFINTLVNRCDQESSRDDIHLLAQLARSFAFGGRKLYKPAYIYYAGHDHSRSDTTDFFNDMTDAPYKILLRASEKLADALKQFIPGLHPLDIIVEGTPVMGKKKDYDMRSIKIWNIRQEEIQDYPSLNDLASFLERNRRAFLFCNPRHYEGLKELAKSSHFDDVISDVRKAMAT